MDTCAGQPRIAYDEDWIELRETELHPEDRENLFIHCVRRIDGGALIRHQACPALDEQNENCLAQLFVVINTNS
jgi:hypothetical protein